MDRISKAKRSKIMAAIRGRDTEPELVVGRILRKFRIKARKNPKTPFGRPDFLLPVSGTVVFVHGCFWHAHASCPYARFPKSRKNYWGPKLRENRLRDKRKLLKWRFEGRRTIVIWACALKMTKGQFGIENRLHHALKSKKRTVDISWRRK